MLLAKWKSKRTETTKHKYNLRFFINGIYYEKNHSYVTIATLDEKLIRFPLDEFELGLMNTKAGIPYRDENLNLSAEEMFKKRESEVKNSNLEGASAYLRKMR